MDFSFVIWSLLLFIIKFAFNGHECRFAVWSFVTLVVQKKSPNTPSWRQKVFKSVYWTAKRPQINAAFFVTEKIYKSIVD
jgi:hypothetical protein